MGASLDGVNIGRDESDERAFYGSRDAARTAKIPQDLESKVKRLQDELPAHVG
jgi:hypothetical protein